MNRKHKAGQKPFSSSFWHDKISMISLLTISADLFVRLVELETDQVHLLAGPALR